MESAIGPLVPLTWRLRRAPSLLVLMYHRVLPAEHPDAQIEQPGMFVSPGTFDMHLSVLEDYFPIVHLDDWLQRAARRESLPKLACAITFDDGWRDNFEFAFPILCRHRAPATIFLVSGLTGSDIEFWPNRLGRLLTSSPIDVTLPDPLAVAIRPAMDEARNRGGWGREQLDRAIVLTKQFSEAEIQSMLDAAFRVAGASTPRRSVLNRQEIRSMSDSGLVRFGSHTRTHQRFRDDLTPEMLRSEIFESAKEIQVDVGRPSTLFCYPNGDTTPAAVELVRTKYSAAVTTRKGWHTPDRDAHLIRRIGVHEDISSRRSAFLARISGLL